VVLYPLTQYRLYFMNKILISLVFCLPLVGQPAFEVASMKQNKSMDPPASNFPLGPGDAYTPNGGRFSATSTSLSAYIGFAYKLVGNQAQSLLDQLPGWVREDRYDIEARAEGNPTKDQMRVMVRSLLAERCKLAIHEETRQVTVSALVVAKPGKLGPQLQPHPAGEPCSLDAPPAATTPDGHFPLLCGGLLQMRPSAPGRVRLGGRNVTMAFLANILSSSSDLGRAMVDRTGLEGKFDFNLEFARTALAAQSSAEPSLDSGPTFEQALKDQFGLKLESQRSQVTVLVLDHIERPSQN
jgi:uncharacterized protein (TIGR03435 family)